MTLDADNAQQAAQDQTRLEGIEHERGRLLQLARKGLWTMEEIEAQMKELNNERLRLEERLEGLKRATERAALLRTRLEKLAQQTSALAGQPDEDLRLVLKQLIKRIEVHQRER